MELVYPPRGLGIPKDPIALMDLSCSFNSITFSCDLFVSKRSQFWTLYTSENFVAYDKLS